MLSTVKSSDSMKGIMAMVVATLLLTFNDTVTKLLTEDYSVWQVLALRHLFSLSVIVPYIHFYRGWEEVRITNRTGMAARSIFFAATTVFIVIGFASLPLALVTAIAFSSPIFVVAFAHFFTSEKVGLRRWLAVFAGFIGVLVIVRPGSATFEYVLIFPVLAALCAGGRDVVTRGLSRTDSSISILLWSNLAVIAVALIATTVLGWKSVTLGMAAFFLLNGLLSASAHFLIIDCAAVGRRISRFSVSLFRFAVGDDPRVIGLGRFP